MCGNMFLSRIKYCKYTRPFRSWRNGLLFSGTCNEKKSCWTAHE
ncbi:hypothetical protein HMPREF3038_02712 [Akkermansia sp. KLE1797]|nr:hypothetical protein HMPREF3038_02712 [Akkermansia sp. KLE1797]KXU53183.1 hypothetical protein HMPREF3039_02739 [Akkermansia sp. KLE1798]KZA03822.1 hypothetical protein HMPREF1326_02595 [Akkermansia sp. KLE1605]